MPSPKIFSLPSIDISIDRFEQAVKVSDQVLGIIPGDVDALRCKIVGLIKVGDYDKALSTIQNLPSTLNDFNFYKAYCLYRQNKLDEALECMHSQEQTSATMLLETQVLYRLGRMDAYEIHGGKNIVAYFSKEFMILPVGASSFKEAMKMGVEVYHNLKLAESDTADSSQNLLDVCVLSHYNQIICETEGLDALRPLRARTIVRKKIQPSIPSSLLSSRDSFVFVLQGNNKNEVEICLESDIAPPKWLNRQTWEEKFILVYETKAVDLTAYVEKHGFCFDVFVLDEQVSNDEDSATTCKSLYKKPYVVVFVGVNGVGKSTNLAKVKVVSLTGFEITIVGDPLILLLSFRQHDVGVMMAVCDTFRSRSCRKRLRTHARRLGIFLFLRRDMRKIFVVAKEAIQRLLALIRM
ncbi:hypothetical protein IFM89_015560 [Coptis chinensis]|uniref:phosphopyruvate hydratase n=1 Tax=Coptis chinensis TaxID=261450 RepID=A0A835I077_9MAGN|nr:hypothetical protein IFM89_015560 [Coptis chinensis]